MELPRTYNEKLTETLKQQIEMLKLVVSMSENNPSRQTHREFTAKTLILNTKNLIKNIINFSLKDDPDAQTIYYQIKIAHGLSKDSNGNKTDLTSKLNEAGKLFLDFTLQPKDKATARKFQQKIDKIKSITAKDAKKWKINKICSWIKYKFKSLLDKLNFRGKNNRAMKYQARKVLEYTSKKAYILTSFKSKNEKKPNTPKQKNTEKNKL